MMKNTLVAASLVLSVGFLIVAYKWLPLLLTTKLSHQFGALNNRFGFGLVDGLIRLGIFLLFIWGMSKMKDIARIFEYHGGEHKTVFAFESREPAAKDVTIGLCVESSRMICASLPTITYRFTRFSNSRIFPGQAYSIMRLTA